MRATAPSRFPPLVVTAKLATAVSKIGPVLSQNHTTSTSRETHTSSLWHLPLWALGRSPGTRQGPAPCKGTCQMWPYSWCRGSLTCLVAMDLQAMATNSSHHGESHSSTADQPIYMRRFAAVARTRKIRTHTLCASNTSVHTRRFVAVARATQASLSAPSALFDPPSHP